ncbi:uncharacterized protein MYCFIDRAFT_171082 [Pseudocercospora fijiensis CIRAD86]|uniref:Uncharacterized protein n=1 Tax=Pseudocercospora fijiensis (strain CIRAD86) TaxID=383855 RepID=N1Q9T0_PSEFD|nr:uncharacterized protein MYCFIDRAFT_171082 [Pseudocercospora fijiensis CIRAD86]EME89660.1 hypothetical protein MYCFIDRAFT_171082 [Pseudocercospora fijiensis CIRAD86]
MPGVSGEQISIELANEKADEESKDTMLGEAVSDTMGFCGSTFRTVYPGFQCTRLRWIPAFRTNLLTCLLQTRCSKHFHSTRKADWPIWAGFKPCSSSEARSPSRLRSHVRPVSIMESFLDIESLASEAVSMALLVGDAIEKRDKMCLPTREQLPDTDITTLLSETVRLGNSLNQYAYLTSSKMAPSCDDVSALRHRFRHVTEPSEAGLHLVDASRHLDESSDINTKPYDPHLRLEAACESAQAGGAFWSLALRHQLTITCTSTRKCILKQLSPPQNPLAS